MSLRTSAYTLACLKLTTLPSHSSAASNIVIIDEAHNLIDSILSLHTVSVSLSQLASIRSGLVTYYAKFKTRFTGANGAYLRQLVLVVKGLAAFAEGWAEEVGGKGKRKRREGMVTANEVLSGLKGGGALDQINLLKLDEYLKNSRIAQKVIKFRTWSMLCLLN